MAKFRIHTSGLRKPGSDGVIEITVGLRSRDMAVRFGLRYHRARLNPERAAALSIVPKVATLIA